jgi:riboflavin kinase / FMN adenylyltransferase
MQVFRHKSELSKDQNTVLTIGTFDGIHLGHREIINKVKQIASGKNSRTFFITFDPHPRQVLSTNFEMKLLTLLPEKIELLESYGIENLFIIPFTREFSQLSSKEFFLEYIIGSVGLNNIVVGFDHHFGKDRGGDFKTLEELGSSNNFGVTVVDPYTVDGEIVSSTKIRKALSSGDMEKANKYLGRSYSLEGKVISGDRRGRELGFPTANIELNSSEKLLPALGIYAVEVLIENRKFKGLLSIGKRPTFYDAGVIVPEVFIFDFDEDIYGRSLKIKLIERIRDEQKYSSAEELIAQMNRDKTEGIRILNKLFN